MKLLGEIRRLVYFGYDWNVWLKLVFGSFTSLFPDFQEALAFDLKMGMPEGLLSFSLRRDQKENSFNLSDPSEKQQGIWGGRGWMCLALAPIFTFQAPSGAAASAAQLSVYRVIQLDLTTEIELFFRVIILQSIFNFECNVFPIIW